MPDVKITLNVSANTLWNLTNPSQAQIDGCCSLSDDNNGNSPNGTIEDFTSQVNLNKNVKWVGVTADSGYTVAIDSISYENEGDDVNIFSSGTITGSGGRSGNVNANVNNDGNLVNQHEDYTINFSIYDTPTEFKSFSIDPKLQVNP
ncbi:hypothetical protein WMW71_06465 [Flavobacterium buctense]|uniref:Uncharacterized protein n=1 Tax=Flavobacterium buctense TaxID=1648146 RepID=A0ABU9E009_9FLAO|nr:hypothetical protein [Flavobacterium buctense]